MDVYDVAVSDFPSPPHHDPYYFFVSLLLWAPASALDLAMNSDLPSHSSAVEEKLKHRSHASLSAWTRPYNISIPGVRTRRLRIYIPNAGPFNQLRTGRMRRKRGPVLVGLACLAVFLTVILVSKSFGRSEWGDQWQGSSQAEPPTLVYQRRDLQKIWKWEIASGHYPSTQTSAYPLSPH